MSFSVGSSSVGLWGGPIKFLKEVLELWVWIMRELYFKDTL